VIESHIWDSSDAGKRPKPTKMTPARRCWLRAVTTSLANGDFVSRAGTVQYMRLDDWFLTPDERGNDESDIDNHSPFRHRVTRENQ
jgi:hypothetical protein